MLSVAGPHEKRLVGREAHKSVISGLILVGIRPVWVDPQWDPRLHLALRGDLVTAQTLASRAYLLDATSPSVLI